MATSSPIPPIGPETVLASNSINASHPMIPKYTTVARPNDAPTTIRSATNGSVLKKTLVALPK